MRRLDKDLIAASPDEVAKQSVTLAKLVGLPCWHLRYAGPPHRIARLIVEHFEKHLSSRPRHDRKMARTIEA